MARKKIKEEVYDVFFIVARHKKTRKNITMDDVLNYFYKRFGRTDVSHYTSNMIKQPKSKRSTTIKFNGIRQGNGKKNIH